VKSEPTAKSMQIGNLTFSGENQHPMVDPSHGRHGDKQLWHYRQWEPNTWPYLMQHGNYSLISKFFRTLSLQFYLQTMTLRNELHSGDLIINGQNALTFDSTSFGTILKGEPSISNTGDAEQLPNIFVTKPLPRIKHQGLIRALHLN
jgi:hypothetical protein